MSSMTDIVFLLLIFFMITSTLVFPNALKVLLPKSNSQTDANPIVSITITDNLEYYVDDTKVNFSAIEATLRAKLLSSTDPTIALYADEKIALGEAVKIMDIANKNKYKMIIATRPK
jgi:biopolymer transport protein ExbD